MKLFKTSRIIFIFLIGVLLYGSFSLVSNAQSEKTLSASEIILILDASGSMWGQIDGENKISIAKKVLKNLVDELPENAEVGLIAYGHRDKGDCKDIETIVAPGPLDKALINKKIEELNPKGKTPITDSVLTAFDLVRTNENATTVILVSDGIETCGGDPCKAVKEAKDAGINFIMHVVGFDVGDVDVSQLECAAQAGGGLYLSAQNASELSEALETAVEIPAELPVGKLSVKVTAEGKLQDSFLKLTNTNTGEELRGQRTYVSSETNPRIISLPDGVYDLEVSPIHMKGVESRKIAGIEIKEGEVVEKEVDFGFGEVSVKVVRNGKLMDSTVYVYKPNTEETIAKGRTYKSSNNNPIVLKLDPGVYDVEIKALEIESSPTQKISAIEIVSGEVLEKLVDYSSGTLKIGALQGEKFIDAVVHINNPETDEQVAKGRTYTSSKSNPKVFELSPGVYDVKVSAVKITNQPSLEFNNIEIKASETIEKTAQFTSGHLKIGAREGEKYLDSVIYITDSKTGERIAQGRTYTSSKSNPKVFDLVPGLYDIKVSAVKIEGKPSQEFKGIELTGEESIEKTAQFSSGVLKVGVVQGDMFIDSIVTIKDSRTGEQITSGRTYTDYKSFVLIPGSYTVTIKALKIEDKPEKTLDVEVKAQETAQIKADFAN